LLLRLGDAIALIYFGVAGLANDSGQSLSVGLHVVAVGGGILLLLGLWTPVAGMVVALDELWNTFSLHFSQPADQWLHVLLAVLAVGVAMLGPGAWSIDARLFGRTRFELNGRNQRPGPTK
jgi:putative oxidoreductase